MEDLARPATLILLAVIIVVSLWTPLAHPAVADRWFTLPNMIVFTSVPVLMLLATVTIVRMGAAEDRRAR